MVGTLRVRHAAAIAALVGVIRAEHGRRSQAMQSWPSGHRPMQLAICKCGRLITGAPEWGGRGKLCLLMRLWLAMAEHAGRGRFARQGYIIGCSRYMLRTDGSITGLAPS